MPDETHQYGDAPVEEPTRKQMEVVMRTLDGYVNGDAKGADRKTGIVVMMFEFGDDPGRCNFMSNGVSRADLVTLMREIVARFEGQPELEGKA